MLVVNDVSSSSSFWFSASFTPCDGISSINGFFQDVLYCSGKHRATTSSMIDTAVEAPGDAPSNPAIDPSSAVMSSVPNSIAPRFDAVRFIVWTRMPACVSAQSSGFTSGTKSLSTSMRETCFCSTCLTR